MMAKQPTEKQLTAACAGMMPSLSHADCVGVVLRLGHGLSPCDCECHQGEEIVIRGEYDVFCNRCRDHHPVMRPCSFLPLLERLDQARN